MVSVWKWGLKGFFKKWGEGLKLKSWGYLGGVVKENEDLLLFDKRDFFEGWGGTFKDRGLHFLMI